MTRLMATETAFISGLSCNGWRDVGGVENHPWGGGGTLPPTLCYMMFSSDGCVAEKSDVSLLGCAGSLVNMSSVEIFLL